MRYYRMIIEHLKTGQRKSYVSSRPGVAPAGYKCISVRVDFSRNKGSITMDIELYQLIQQVAEMARQAAIDKAACDVVQSDVIGE